MRRSLARQLCGVLLVLALALAIAAWLLHSDEPAYQGKRLGAWIDEVGKAQEEEGLAQVELRREMVTNVVRVLDRRALPCALRWLRESPGRWLYDEVQDRVERLSGGRIRLPERKDRRWEGVYVIQILGPAAEQAIPELAQMLTNEQTCDGAFQCLPAIGLASFPAISNAVAVGSSHVRYRAIQALGELGPAAEVEHPVAYGDQPNCPARSQLYAPRAG